MIAGCSGSSTSPSRQSDPIPGLAGTAARLNGNADQVWEVECTPIDQSTPRCPDQGFRPAQRVLAPFSEWLAPPSGVGWIGVNDRATLPTGFGDQRPRYQYLYRISFDLTGFDPSTARLELEWAADNYFGGYRLNAGTYLGELAENRQWLSFKPLALRSPGAAFVAGRNVLELRVMGDGQTDGLIVRDFRGTAERR